MIPAGPFSFDAVWSRAVQSYQPGWLTMVAKTVSAIGQPEIIVSVFFVVALWLLVRRQSIHELQLVFILIGNFLTLVIKSFVHRPRPNPSMVHVLVHETATSFPSGHAVAAVLTAGAIWLLFRTRRPAWLHVILILYVLAIGWSRIYLGVHWLSDVLAGYIVGLAWLALTIMITP